MTSRRWLFGRSAGTLTATAILVFALLVAVGGSLTTRAQIRASFDRQKNIQQAQLDLEQMIKTQLDEETAVRGYTITRDTIFLDPYYSAVGKFEPLEKQLAAVLRSEDLQNGQMALEEFDTVHEEWHKAVADPLITSPSVKISIQVEKRGKALVDQERADAAFLEDLLARRNAEVANQTQAQVNQTGYTRAIWLVIFGVLAILFNTYRSRTRAQLESERTTTMTLQRAFKSAVEQLPHCEIGTAYVSAARDLAIGGDVFDVYRLAETQALVLIADVSGKGVDAAVLTAFIKFTIRGIALRRRDPGAILAEFNTAFPRTVTDPYLFVSMFVGIFDFENRTLSYASGGHDAIFLRRADGSVEQLSVTGPILGVMEEPFATRLIRLQEHDMVVLSTDGLTEARNSAGEQLGEGARELIAQGPAQPQALVDMLMAQLRARTGRRMSDDVAILAIKLHGDGPP